MLMVQKTENSFLQVQSAVSLARSRLLEGEMQAEGDMLGLEQQKAALDQKWIAYNEMERKLKQQEVLFAAGGISREAIQEKRFSLEGEKNSLLLEEKQLEISGIGFRDADLLNAGMSIPDDSTERKRAFVELATATVRSEYKAALAQLEGTKQELESARISESDLCVYSPVAGTIAAKYMETGERVKLQDKLFTIIETDSLYASMSVRESDAFLIKKGMNAVVALDGTNSKYSGTVDLVAPVADTQSFTFSVRILLPEEAVIASLDKESGAGLVRPGMFARVAIEIGPPHNAVVLPDSAIVKKEKDSGIVYVVNGKVASERKVVFGKSVGDSLEIVSGIKSGEAVVTRPDSRIQDGIYVSVAK
jgi:RND family efflux transporter MFP subunit